MGYVWTNIECSERNEIIYKKYSGFVIAYNKLVQKNEWIGKKPKNVKKLVYYFYVVNTFDKDIDAMNAGIKRATYYRAKKEVKEVMYYVTEIF